MTTLLIIAIIVFAVRYGPPLIVWPVAMALGMLLVCRSRWIGEQMVRARDVSGGFDRRPTRAQRGLMRAHLKLAIDQTALASLLPGVMATARTRADR